VSFQVGASQPKTRPEGIQPNRHITEHHAEKESMSTRSKLLSRLGPWLWHYGLHIRINYGPKEEISVVKASQGSTIPVKQLEKLTA
jgi:hypothetical protein